jgi:hypothetical protein
VKPSNELLTKVETLQNILVSRATGGAGQTDEPDYRLLRQDLTAIPSLAATLPRFVHTCRDLFQFWSFIKPKFSTYAERRQYIWDEFRPLLSSLEIATQRPSDAPVSQTLSKVDSAHVQEAWQKALERRATDPEGAITAARTLLESVCKHILDKAAVAYDDNADLPKLYSLAAKQLNLSPSQHTEQLFRQILGGCQTVVEGLGALRNRLSDAHGKGKAGVRPAPRHAELAVNLAGTMAMFLLASLEARRQS